MTVRLYDRNWNQIAACDGEIGDLIGQLCIVTDATDGEPSHTYRIHSITTIDIHNERAQIEELRQ